MHHHAVFNDKSDIYRAARPIYPDDLLSYVVGLTEQQKTAWDCATGSGQAAVPLARYFDIVYATDVSENQIAHAMKHDKVIYSVDQAETPKFAEASLDLITVAQALHWFDYRAYWPAVRRVLKAGGVFAAWGYDWFVVSPEIDAIIKEKILDRIATYWMAQNRLLWEGYKAVEFPFERIATPAFELRMEWDLDHLFAYIHSWSATRRCMEKEGNSFFFEGYDAVSKAWGDSRAQRTVLMPLHVVVGRN